MSNNAKTRTIMIFPKFKNIQIIDRIREKYDPLSNHVRPHITLIFSFESNLSSTKLKEHLEKVLKDTPQFKLTMEKIMKIDNDLGMYLFLTVKEGSENLQKISSKLYTGIIESYKPFWLNEETFMPHMTIGNFTSRDDLEKAFKDIQAIKENFTTIVDEISVEIVDENEDSIIEIVVPLLIKPTNN